MIEEDVSAQESQHFATATNKGSGHDTNISRKPRKQAIRKYEYLGLTLCQ
jgi:hypothetical protein